MLPNVLSRFQGHASGVQVQQQRYAPQMECRLVVLRRQGRSQARREEFPRLVRMKIGDFERGQRRAGQGLGRCHQHASGNPVGHERVHRLQVGHLIKDDQGARRPDQVSADGHHHAFLFQGFRLRKSQRNRDLRKQPRQGGGTAAGNPPDPVEIIPAQTGQFHREIGGALSARP